MSSDKKIIVVIGGTGAQGGGLVRAILDDKEGGFGVRAVTRSVDGDKAKALIEQGAEVVAANLDDQASLEAAFAGAYGAYAVTNFWEHFSVDKELEQARNVAQAAKAAGLKHVVWSTLEDTRRDLALDDDRLPTLQGKYKVPHFDGKGEAEKFFAEAGVPTTNLLTSFYLENFIYFGMGPKKGADGRLAITLPIGDVKLPVIGVEDIGRSAYGIFRAGDKYVNQTVGVAGDHVSGQEIADAFAAKIGKEVVFNAVDRDTYASFGFPGAEDLANMFHYKVLFNDKFRASRPLDFTREVNPQVQSLAAWLDANAAKVPIE